MRSPTARDRFRAASVEQIKALMENGPISALALTQAVSVGRGTLYEHLEYMHQTLRIARPTGRKIGHSIEWELGEDPALPSTEYRDQLAKTKRDPLVAALFGAPRAHQ